MESHRSPAFAGVTVFLEDPEITLNMYIAYPPLDQGYRGQDTRLYRGLKTIYLILSQNRHHHNGATPRPYITAQRTVYNQAQFTMLFTIVQIHALRPADGMRGTALQLVRLPDQQHLDTSYGLFGLYL
jgi:hypothetical protein